MHHNAPREKRLKEIKHKETQSLLLFGCKGKPLTQMCKIAHVFTQFYLGVVWFYFYPSKTLMGCI